MDITECVGGVMREIRETVRSQTVVGMPIRSGETVIIPVSRITFGFGVFGGAGSKLKRREAMGAGAGVSVEPVAFVFVAKGKPRLLSIQRRAAAVSRLFEIVPPVLKLVVRVVRSRRNKHRAHTRGNSEGR
jgi:uncharacterized spore protein YtfJ